MDKKTLLGYIPDYYSTSKVIDNINNSNASELTIFETKLNNVLNQFFIDTSDYSLERWEKEFGIEVNNNYDIDFRRTRIMAKLRGHGTVTVDLIKTVSESFSNGEVDVIEDNTNYSFTVKFVSILGIPPNMDDLQKAIEDIKPAHLGFSFAYTYNTYNVLTSQTYESLATLTHDAIKIHQF